MKKFQILTTVFKVLHDLAFAVTSSQDYSAQSMMDLYQFFKGIELFLPNASAGTAPSIWSAFSMPFHLTNFYSFNRFWFKYPFCREDHTDFQVTPFILIIPLILVRGIWHFSSFLPLITTYLYPYLLEVYPWVSIHQHIYFLALSPKSLEVHLAWELGFLIPFFNKRSQASLEK